MIRQRVSLCIAIVVACIGCVVAVRALMHNRVKPAATAPAEAPESVRTALTSATIDTAPTPENVDDIATELHRRVLIEIRGVPSLAQLSESVQIDLADAFVERWRALIHPDVNRDHETLVARGDPRSLANATMQYEQYRGWMESLSMSPVGLDGVIVTDDADPTALLGVASDARFADFGRSVTRRAEDTMPVPEHPLEEGWRSVEIVMPFEKPPLQGEGLGVVFLGFQFAWSAERGQWIPYSAVMYTAPNETHAAVPFR